MFPFSKDLKHFTEDEIERWLSTAEPGSIAHDRVLLERQRRQTLQQNRIALVGIAAAFVLGVATIVAQFLVK